MTIDTERDKAISMARSKETDEFLYTCGTLMGLIDRDDVKHYIKIIGLEEPVADVRVALDEIYKRIIRE